jgi:hypothetical protein
MKIPYIVGLVVIGLEALVLIYFRCRRIERKTHRLARFVKKIKNKLKRGKNEHALSEFDDRFVS